MYEFVWILGYERKVLENPHSVHNYGSSVYHTKVLRLFFARSPLSSTTNTPGGTPIRMTGNYKDPASGHHVLHKTFHIPVVMLPSCVKLNSQTGVILPQQHMEDTMAKVRRWIALKGKYVRLLPHVNFRRFMFYTKVFSLINGWPWGIMVP